MLQFNAQAPLLSTAAFASRRGGARSKYRGRWAKVLAASTDATPESVSEETARRATDALPFELDMPKAGEAAILLQLYEPIDVGSPTYTLTTVKTLVHARTVRVTDVDLAEVVRPTIIPTAASARSRRGASSSSAPSPAPAPSAPPPRFKLKPEGRKLASGATTNGLHEIRAEMPTIDDSWEVEDVVQFKTYYRKEYWLIKWKGYGEDRNTWEPWDNLLEEWVQDSAREVREQARAAS